MKELRTLKDFEKLCNSKGEEFVLFCLKAEAVKWVKEMLNIHFYNTFPTTQSFCMNFFNLTSEDIENA